MLDKYNRLGKSPLLKVKEDEAERSGLTEEHGQLVCSQILCHSPDSSSNKRKGDDDKGYITKTRGNILRIRLPLQRHREPNTSITAESLCSDHGNAESLPQHNEITTAPGHGECSSVNSKTGIGELGSGDIKQTCVTDLEVKENSRHAHARTDYGKKSHEKREQTVDSLYKVLIEDWIPSSLEFDQDNFDDQEWFFPQNKRESHGNKRFKLSYHDESCHASPSLWPSARYLHEADVYALPYTVPF